MKILIKNANIITMDKMDFSFGEILIQDDIIVFVGKKYDGSLVPDRVIDASGNIVMPGFINAHTHTAMSIFKNLSDNKGLQDWLYEDILPLEKNLDEKIVYDATMLGISEYVRNGVTTFCDAYYYPNATIKAVIESGIRATICLGFHPNDTRSIEDIEKEYLDLKDKSANVQFMLYAHSIYETDETQIGALINLAHKYKLPLYTHLCETLEEVSNCTVKYDVTPPKLLEELGFFDQSSTVAHCVHLDKEDLEILEKYNVNVVSNPASNLKLGSGIAPIYSMQKHNINIALGTDGASSNNSLDMFREMYLVSTLQKGVLHDASVISAKETLKMATQNGAKALYLNKVGMLRKDYKADLIMLDTSTPNLTPLNNSYSAIVYSCGVQNVILTMVNGKILYENGKYFIGKEITNILKNVLEQTKKLK